MNPISKQDTIKQITEYVKNAYLAELQEKHPIDTVETLLPVASDLANQLVTTLTDSHKREVVEAEKLQTEIIFRKWQSFPDDGEFTNYLADEISRLKRELKLRKVNKYEK